MGFAEPLPQGFSRSNQHCNCRATADRGSVHSRTGPDASMENETLLVPDRRRGSHDQSENAAFHGRSHESQKVHSHPVDHSPMYTEANLVIDVIPEAARETLAR